MKGGEPLDTFINLPVDGQAKHLLRLPISCAISHRSSMACISRLFFQVACACITTRVIHAYLQFRRSSVALYYSSRPYATPTHPIAHHRLRIQSQHRPFDDWFTCILRYLFRARLLLLWFLARYVVLFPPQDVVSSLNLFNFGKCYLLVIYFWDSGYFRGTIPSTVTSASIFSWIWTISWRFRFTCDAEILLVSFSCDTSVWCALAFLVTLYQVLARFMLSHTMNDDHHVTHRSGALWRSLVFSHPSETHHAI